MRISVVLIATSLVFSYGALAQSGRSNSFSYGTGSSGSSHYVAPHSSGNGGYTGGHYQTNPDSSRSNNYGSYGNYNSHNNGVGNGYGRSVPRY